jgi:hypothetical protein
MVSLLLAGGALVLWLLEMIVRGSTCGPAEGGGSCSAGVTSYALLTASLLALALGVALLTYGGRPPR